MQMRRSPSVDYKRSRGTSDRRASPGTRSTHSTLQDMDDVLARHAVHGLTRDIPPGAVSGGFPQEAFANAVAGNFGMDAFATYTPDIPSFFHDTLAPAQSEHPTIVPIEPGPMPGIEAGVILASHPSLVWTGIAPGLVTVDPLLFPPITDPLADQVDVAPIHVPERLVESSPPHPHPVESELEPVTRPPPRPNPRKRPVVEIPVRPKKPRKVLSPPPPRSVSRSPTRGEMSSPDTDSYAPSVKDVDSDSDSNPGLPNRAGNSKTEEGERVRRHRRRRRGTKSRPRPTKEHDYGRKTDWERHAFSRLHGELRCIFCPAIPVGVKPQGKVHRLPDAAARHLRDSCRYFEGSELYKKYGGGDANVSKKEVVARMVRQYEKIAIAQVYCRREEGHVARCAAIEMTPLLVEAKLGRHAALYKVGDCECCPLPRWSEYLARAEQERKEQERVYRERLSRSGRVSLKDETKEEKVVKARVKERHAPKVQSTLSGDSEEDEVALMLDGRLDIIIAC
ncbi:hypothetical protein C8Q76DRAFT_320412 [Earliella scabrosa]|nr:hypothetical protein C8Q76DRAFT_320412 [Earliella scabrosa]